MYIAVNNSLHPPLVSPSQILGRQVQSQADLFCALLSSGVRECSLAEDKQCTLVYSTDSLKRSLG